MVNEKKSRTDKNEQLAYTNHAFQIPTEKLSKASINNESKEIVLSWRSVSVSAPTGILSMCVNSEKSLKRIIKNANGLVRSGEMLALMGASGSGKTTLLNVLNFRSAGDLNIDGKIMINGMTASSEKISMISSYIQQDYLFFGTLTVQEHLNFHVLFQVICFFFYKFNFF